jgi:hypothetical protein
MSVRHSHATTTAFVKTECTHALLSPAVSLSAHFRMFVVLVSGRDGYICVCESGWAGVVCDTNVNECSSTPCVHGGTCIDGVDSYTCLCPPGWSGNRCQRNINECASQPCVNGATCVDKL